jgi:hypothetical protein
MATLCITPGITSRSSALNATEKERKGAEKAKIIISLLFLNQLSDRIF